MRALLLFQPCVTGFPAAATLSAQIKGLPDFFDVDWRENIRYPFGILGKNPLDATAQAYINANVDAEFQSFVWAIVRHESRAGNRVYNQFNPNASQSFFEQPNKTVPKPPATEAWGFGMAQIDRGEDGRTTDVAWDWHASIAQMNRVLREKKGTYNRLLGDIRCEYGNLSTWNEPPTTFTTNGWTASSETWGVITLYNGAGGLPEQYVNKKDIQCPWVFNPTNGKWDLYRNSKDYARKIAEEIANTLTGVE